MSWPFITFQLIISIAPPLLVGFPWYLSIVFGLMSFFFAKKFPTLNLFISFPCWAVGFLFATYCPPIILAFFVIDFILYSAFFFISPSLRLISCEDTIKNDIICFLFLFLLIFSSQFFFSYNALQEYRAFRQTSFSDEYQQYLRDKEDETEMVWIPRTGEKYHDNPSCSGMNSPREVSRKQAKDLGYTACGKCY